MKANPEVPPRVARHPGLPETVPVLVLEALCLGNLSIPGNQTGLVLPCPTQVEPLRPLQAHLPPSAPQDTSPASHSTTAWHLLSHCSYFP